MNVIEIEGVSVKYRKARVHSLKEALVQSLTSRREVSWFYGLQNVSLEIRHGESVGIIGRNGAGKSTLLRIAAGIITPSEGVVVTRGTIAPVMELGTGFESELTGRENIFFNGALLGCSRWFMRDRIDDIIAFSGLERFIDDPLRTYSTGMTARLAFSIATSIEADTILLDEIMSVGDAAFRRKCASRIHRFVNDGSTVVVVSHDLEALRALCPRTIWMRKGQVLADGPTSEVIDAYSASDTNGDVRG